MYYTDSFEQDWDVEEEEISSLYLPRPTKVREKLFIGCQDSSRSKFALRNSNISHILDLTGAKPSFPNDFEYFTVEKLEDAPCSDLLSHLPQCISFIEKGLKDGTGVLVHCAAGVSRSASVVVSYVMKADRISFEEALTIVKTVRPIINPNCGFIKQLKMWEKMEYKLDGNTRAHRLYKLEKLSKKFQQTGELPTFIPFEDPQDTCLDTNVIYSCKQCQRELFLESQVIEHSKGVGHHGKTWCCSSIECDSFFVEPLVWMDNLAKEGGKLSCPKCEIHIGEWTWSESSCSCTSIVYPSFRIQKSNVFKERNRSRGEMMMEPLKPNSLS